MLQRSHDDLAQKVEALEKRSKSLSGVLDQLKELPQQRLALQSHVQAARMQQVSGVVSNVQAAAFGEKGSVFTRNNLLLAGNQLFWVFLDPVLRRFGVISGTAPSIVTWLAPVGSLLTGQLALANQQHVRFISGVSTVTEGTVTVETLRDRIADGFYEEFQRRTDIAVTAVALDEAPFVAFASVRQGVLRLGVTRAGIDDVGIPLSRPQLSLPRNSCAWRGWLTREWPVAEGPLSKVARILAGVVLVQGRLGHQVLGQLLIAGTNDAAIAAAAVVVAGTTRTRNAAAQVALRTAAPAIAAHALLQGEEKRINRREQLLRDRETQLAARDARLVQQNLDLEIRAATLEIKATNLQNENAKESRRHSELQGEFGRLQDAHHRLQEISTRLEDDLARCQDEHTRTVLAFERDSAQKDQRIAELHAAAEQPAPKRRATPKQPSAAKRAKKRNGRRRNQDGESCPADRSFRALSTRHLVAPAAAIARPISSSPISPVSHRA